MSQLRGRAHRDMGSGTRRRRAVTAALALCDVAMRHQHVPAETPCKTRRCFAVRVQPALGLVRAGRSESRRRLNFRQRCE
jgi:hypothetical protein